MYFMIVKPGSSEYDNTTKLCSEELVGNGLERSIEHDGLASACAAPPVTVVVDQDDSEIGHPLIGVNHAERSIWDND